MYVSKLFLNICILVTLLGIPVNLLIRAIIQPNNHVAAV